MAIPKAVVKQAEEAERVRLESIGKKPVENPEGNPPEVPQQPTPEKPEKPAETPKDDWKLRHDKLYGQYTEIIATNRAFAEELANLRAEISELHAAKKKETEKTPELEGDDIELKTFREQYPDVSRMSEIQLKRELSRRDQVINSLQGRLEKLETGVSTVEKRVNRNEGQTFEERMDALVKGDWRYMNDYDRDFWDWLKREKIKGHLRWNLFQASLQKNDVAGVAEHFNDYIELQNPNPEKPKKESPSPEEENIAPPRPGTASRPAKTEPAAETPITRSFIKAYYKARAVGQDFYWNKSLIARRGDKKAWEKINADIESAVYKGAVLEE